MLGFLLQDLYYNAWFYKNKRKCNFIINVAPKLFATWELDKASLWFFNSQKHLSFNQTYQSCYNKIYLKIAETVSSDWSCSHSRNVELTNRVLKQLLHSNNCAQQNHNKFFYLIITLSSIWKKQTPKRKTTQAPSSRPFLSHYFMRFIYLGKFNENECLCWRKCSGFISAIREVIFLGNCDISLYLQHETPGVIYIETLRRCMKWAMKTFINEKLCISNVQEYAGNNTKVLETFHL